MASAPAQRRGFLGTVIGALAAALAAVVALPGIAFFAAPLRRETVQRGKTPLRVARLSAVKPGRPLRCDVRGELIDAWNRVPDVKLGSCWLVRSAEDGKVRAFSTVCPHLGCALDFSAEERKFVCPCHQSFFSLDGKVTTGPSPRDMDELDVVTAGSEVRVVYRRFRVGTAKKVEV
jgi:Rieske Fe-S protein